MCWHKWKKWERYDIQVSNAETNNILGIDKWQKRVCEKCNKEKHVKIKYWGD